MLITKKKIAIINLNEINNTSRSIPFSCQHLHPSSLIQSLIWERSMSNTTASPYLYNATHFNINIIHIQNTKLVLSIFILYWGYLGGGVFKQTRHNWPCKPKPIISKLWYPGSKSIHAYYHCYYHCYYWNSFIFVFVRKSLIFTKLAIRVMVVKTHFVYF